MVAEVTPPIELGHIKLDLKDVPELRGWPTNTFGLPTDHERYLMRCIHHELLMHEPDFGEDRAWFLAGQTVARIRRDADSA